MTASALALIAALAGVLVGGVFAWMLARAGGRRELAEAAVRAASDVATALARVEAADSRLADVQHDLERTRGELEISRQDLASAAEYNATLQAELKHQLETAALLKELVDKADLRFRDAFGALAADALKQNNQSFLQLAETTFGKLQTAATGELEKRQKAVDELVRPLRETLEKVDAKIGQSEQQRAVAFAELQQQLGSLSLTTTVLSRALRTPQVRGRWGEMQLRRVVEIAGMLEHCDFEEQVTVHTDAGRLRPDMVVHLPGGKRIVIDAKAPLDAFLDAQETPDDDVRAAKLLHHARQVRAHMDQLGGKAYQAQFEFTPEIVILFLPGETLFSTALQHDLQMIESGLQKRVLLASPITLIALLTTIAHTWRQEALEENARDISRLGQQLHDGLRAMAGHLDDLRKRIDGSVQCYNKVVGSFETNVLSKARQLKDRQMVTGEDLPRIESVDASPRLLRDAPLLGVVPPDVVDADAESSTEPGEV